MLFRSKDDRKILATDTGVSVVNLLPGSFFKQIDIQVNKVLIPQLTTNFAHYRNYFEQGLSYGSDASKTHKKLEMFHPDTSGAFDTRGAANTGFTTRRDYIKDNKPFECFYNIANDLCRLDKFLPPDIEFDFTFHEAPRTFYIMGDNDNYQMNVIDMKLYCKYIELHEPIHKAILTTAETKPYIYQAPSTTLKHYIIPQENSSYNVPYLFSGKLPSMLLLSFVSQKAFYGDIQSNPFTLTPKDIEKADLRRNGASYPGIPYTFDTAVSGLKYIRAYSDFVKVMGLENDNAGNLITPGQYSRDTFMLAYDFNPDTCQGQHVHKADSGVLSVELTFKSGIPTPVVLLVYATFNSEVIFYGSGHKGGSKLASNVEVNII